MGTPNHYNNSAPYRQSPTPTYQTHIQQTPTRQTHNIMQHAPTPQQQPHVGGASMQQQQHNTFNQQNNQQVQVHHRSSIEFAAQKVYAIDPNSVASFYEACQNNPGLLPIDVAIHFAPDPTPTFCGEKLHSLNMTYGYYNSPNCWKYDVSSEYRNPTLNFRLNTKRQSLTYAEVYHDGEKLKSFLKLYDEKIWFVAANGEDKYDLRKLFDPSGGVTIQYTNNGQTYTIGWKSVPQEAGGDLFAHRANILKYCEKEGKPLLVRVFFLMCSHVLVSIISHITNPLLLLLTSLLSHKYSFLLSLPISSHRLLIRLSPKCPLQRQRQQYRRYHFPLFLHKSPL